MIIQSYSDISNKCGVVITFRWKNVQNQTNNIRAFRWNYFSIQISGIVNPKIVHYKIIYLDLDLTASQPELNQIWIQKLGLKYWIRN